MNKNGFTLIEIVLSIVLLSLAASVFISFFQTGLIQSPNPLNRLQDNYTALQAIEAFQALYRKDLTDDPEMDLLKTYGIDGENRVDLSGQIGLSNFLATDKGVQIWGEIIRFSTPDAQRRVHETTEATGDDPPFIRITVTQNNCSLVTLLGN